MIRKRRLLPVNDNDKGFGAPKRGSRVGMFQIGDTGGAEAVISTWTISPSTKAPLHFSSTRIILLLDNSTVSPLCSPQIRIIAFNLVPTCKMPVM